MPQDFSGGLQAAGSRFAIVAGRFNDFITSRLVAGAIDALQRHGCEDKDISVVHVPGSFEVPFVAKRLAESGQYHAIICLGCVIRGQTPHFEYVASEAAKGVAMVSWETGVPATFGVITSDTLEQAIERSGSKAGNKGVDAALSAIELVNLLSRLPKKA